ncbi:MAG: NAD(P)-dependent alcohol dehydrogenase [Bacteroidetes bacterium]|nr:NAD(P)-dependent alcohol dehydrogenase [Bacteroidota bacterium]
MKAILYKEYGQPEVLQLVEREKPTPKDNEVLIKINATTVTATECMFRQGKPLATRLFVGLTKPKITRLGEELAGEIVTVGKEVTKFKTGDKVFGTAGPKFGANAEYLCVNEDGVLTLKPDNMNFDEAASGVDGFLTAMPFLRDVGKIKKDQSVLIIGASGSVGSAAVQIAKYFETEVTGVCSTSNVDLVKSIGADTVLDYTKEDFTESVHAYDIIFDAVGKTSFSKAKKSLKKNGVFLEAAFGMGVFTHVLWTSFFGGKKAKIAATGLRPPTERTKDLILLKQLMEEGKIKPVIDKTYPMEKIVEAHRYVDKGHKKGNVVIKVQ